MERGIRHHRRKPPRAGFAADLADWRFTDPWIRRSISSRTRKGAGRRCWGRGARLPCRPAICGLDLASRKERGADLASRGRGWEPALWGSGTRLRERGRTCTKENVDAYTTDLSSSRDKGGRSLGFLTLG
ncbi:hypothetical protein Zm00014a_001551 [Zea mays]|uniref:Uncharacterized protein n=1 Tax=Zea mays TaxID=4577 RepID=A0A3L6DCB1_MAIZE|nr:hypothetical protein Zm00014a_001551 [Zea mays]